MHSSNSRKIITTLGLDSNNGLFITQKARWKKKTNFPNRVNRLLERKLKPTAFFCFDNRPLVLFFENPTDKTALHKALWNFNESPIIIIVEEDSVEIFNGFKYEFEKESLQKIGGSEKLNDFTYFELVTGRAWEQYKDDLNYKNRVDYHLLENIKATRELLIKNEDETFVKKKNEDRARIINALLGKAIFVRYLIDRKVKMKFDGKLRIWTNEEFCELLDSPKQIKQFFEYFF